MTRKNPIPVPGDRVTWRVSHDSWTGEPCSSWSGTVIKTWGPRENRWLRVQMDNRPPGFEATITASCCIDHQPAASAAGQ